MLPGSLVGPPRLVHPCRSGEWTDQLGNLIERHLDVVAANASKVVAQRTVLRLNGWGRRRRTFFTKPDHWPLFFEEVNVVLGPGMDLVRLDRRPVALLIEPTSIDLVRDLSCVHPGVVIVFKDDCDRLVQCQPAGRS